MKHISLKIAVFTAFAAVMMLTACRKDDYYQDGGLSRQSEEEKRMTAYDFLASRSNHMFDSLIKIIDLTNAKALVNQPNITLFAPPNQAVMKFQRRYNPDDRQEPMPLASIGKDTLLKLLNRFVVPNSHVTVEQGIKEKKLYFFAPTGDSLIIYGEGGGVAPGSSLQTSAFYLRFEHRKIPGTDTAVYSANIQTHNLVTANAMVHVLVNSADFTAGHKHKFYR